LSLVSVVEGLNGYLGVFVFLLTKSEIILKLDFPILVE